MPKNDEQVEVVKSRQAQSEDSKRATFDMLRTKPRAEREVTFVMNPDTDDEQEFTMLFRAIGATDYDKLITKNPPNTEQKADGASYNINTFGPSLLAKTVIEPDMDFKQWSEIWNSDEWNRGEILQIFLTATDLCNRGLDVPPTVTD